MSSLSKCFLDTYYVLGIHLGQKKKRTDAVLACTEIYPKGKQPTGAYQIVWSGLRQRKSRVFRGFVSSEGSRFLLQKEPLTRHPKGLGSFLFKQRPET